MRWHSVKSKYFKSACARLLQKDSKSWPTRLVDKSVIDFVSFFCTFLLMPRRNYQPRIFICNNGETRTCQSGFSTMSGLTRHRNAMHPPPNIQPLPVQVPFFPPPDEMDFDDGDNDLGPHEATEGNMQTVRHPILNGKSFFHFFVIFSTVFSRQAMWFPWKLSASRYSSSPLHMWRWCGTQRLVSFPQSCPVQDCRLLI